MPGTGNGKLAYEKLRDRARFRRKDAVEPVIDHLKSDYLMLRNYLMGIEGDMINPIMAAVAFNMKIIADPDAGNRKVKYGGSVF